MVKKLIQHGNSSALIIDKALMEVLKIDADTPLEIATDGKNLFISPVHNENRTKDLHTALEKLNKVHGATLKRLAE
ncbi:MAG: AbrB/MazE/SpoVT family DNA-binding domain-containing protein [Spirochaetes bacterium]|nr:MAG: AbrB/MazE/SpoVT family DNA-binding domain-containing protein [Spirochaetota bacterium]